MGGGQVLSSSSEPLNSYTCELEAVGAGEEYLTQALSPVEGKDAFGGRSFSSLAIAERLTWESRLPGSALSWSIVVSSSSMLAISSMLSSCSGLCTRLSEASLPWKACRVVRVVMVEAA